jgi:Holliday junction DNA helicase RuvA
MIGYLKGKIIANRQGYIILSVGNVGYKINSSSKKILKTGDEIEQFMHHHIREEINDLYGFDTLDELELFQKLISVNGVGPKAGVAILSSAGADRITQAIVTGDTGFFTAVSGIGKKVAAKIILDLRSKISSIGDGLSLEEFDKNSDLVDALTSLGYKREEIARLITKIPVEISGVESQVKWCLKNLGKINI